MAREEVKRLQGEREEMAFINGRLLLRLQEMEGSIGRLKKNLKVEDAAEKLNSAFSAAKEAQRIVGDTAVIQLRIDIVIGGEHDHRWSISEHATRPNSRRWCQTLFPA